LKNIKISQIILIGDAAPNTKLDYAYKTKDNRWTDLKGSVSQARYYEEELEDLIENGVKV